MWEIVKIPCVTCKWWIFKGLPWIISYMQWRTSECWDRLYCNVFKSQNFRSTPLSTLTDDGRIHKTWNSTTNPPHDVMGECVRMGTLKNENSLIMQAQMNLHLHTQPLGFVHDKHGKCRTCCSLFFIQMTLCNFHLNDISRSLID